MPQIVASRYIYVISCCVLRCSSEAIKQAYVPTHLLAWHCRFSLPRCRPPFLTSVHTRGTRSFYSHHRARRLNKPETWSTTTLTPFRQTSSWEWGPCLNCELASETLYIEYRQPAGLQFNLSTVSNERSIRSSAAPLGRLWVHSDWLCGLI